MLTKQHVEEDLSRAYVQAVAARAGVILRLGDRSHDYTIDGTFSQISYIHGRRHESGFHLDFQLKATKNLIIADGLVKHDLDVETYNYLVSRCKTPGTTPLVLIVFSLPNDENAWLSLSEEELILRHCCYWISLDGTFSLNRYSRRIEILQQNLLTPETVIDLLRKVAEGKELSSL